MPLKKVIRKGDTTDHGGVVIEGIEEVVILDKPIACKGHMVQCPKCNGVYPIIEGVEHMPINNNKLVAVEGMKTACGASLIASQEAFQLDTSASKIT